MRKCYKQRCASKTAKKTRMQCDVGCNSIHRSINNGFNHGLIEVFVDGELRHCCHNYVTLRRRHRNVIPSDGQLKRIQR